MTSAEEYIKSLFVNVPVDEITIKGILIDAGIDEETFADDLTEKQKDLSMAYLILRLLTPFSSKSVTDRDGDWEHSEGGAQWSAAERQQYLILARKLLEKWGLNDDRLDALSQKWGFKGTGFRKIRRYR